MEKTKLQEIRENHKKYSNDELAEALLAIKNEHEKTKKVVLIGTAMLDDMSLVYTEIESELNNRLTNNGK